MKSIAKAKYWANYKNINQKVACNLEIKYTKDAVKQINAIDKPAKERIKAAIEALPKGDIKKLKGYTSKYRLRVGTYRIIYDIQDNTLTIGAVLPRGDAYKKI